MRHAVVGGRGDRRNATPSISRSLRAVSARLLVGIFLVVSVAFPAFAERRVALVIGNSGYKNTVELTNPSHDATDVAAALRTLGFEVVFGDNLDRHGTEDALQRFTRLARGADVALFFYAGHGMQFGGRNYLMPIDAQLQDEVSVRYEMTAMDDVREALQASPGVKIMILDACRNNPLAERLSRSIASKTRAIPVVQGFSPVAPDDGMLVEYSTQPNQVADDGTAHNSPFTAALLTHLKEPGLEIGTMFRRVGNDVYKATNGAQSPEMTVSLHSDFYLNPGQASPPIEPAVAAIAPAKPAAAPDAAPPAAPSAPVSAAPPAPVWAPIKVANAPANEPPDSGKLTRSINLELRRIGCYSGDADADWMSAGVKGAVADVIRNASLAQPPATPSPEFLLFLKGQTDRLCPLNCSPREIARNGQCVAKTCGPGEAMNPKGECIVIPAARPQPLARREVVAPRRASQLAAPHRPAPKPEPAAEPEVKQAAAPDRPECRKDWSVGVGGGGYWGASLRQGMCN